MAGQSCRNYHCKHYWECVDIKSFTVHGFVYMTIKSDES